MKTTKFYPTLVLVTLMSAASALAADNPGTQPSAPAPAEAPSINEATKATTGSSVSVQERPGVLDSFTLSLRFEGYGPSINEGTGLRPNVDKELTRDPKAEVYSKNKLNIGYKLNSQYTTGLGLQFYALSHTGSVFQEPYAYIRNSHLVQAGNFNWDSQVKVYGGFTKVSEKYNDVAQLRLAGDASYRFNGMFAVGLIHELYYYVLSKRALESRELEFDLWPHADAQVTQNFVASLILKSFFYHNVGHTFFDQKLDPVLISPNLTFTFLKKSLAVNPYLDIPVSHLQAGLTTVGLNLNWKIL